MILNHGHHSVLHVLLILSQLGWHFLVKLLGKSLDDHVAICDFLAVELNEGQHSLLGAVLALVIHILVLDPVKLQPRLQLETEGRDRGDLWGSGELEEVHGVLLVILHVAQRLLGLGLSCGLLLGLRLLLLILLLLVGQSGLLLSNDFFVGFDGFVNLGIILRGLNYGLTSHFIRYFHCVYYSQFSTRYAS